MISSCKGAKSQADSFDGLLQSVLYTEQCVVFRPLYCIWKNNTWQEFPVFQLLNKKKGVNFDIDFLFLIAHV